MTSWIVYFDICDFDYDLRKIIYFNQFSLKSTYHGIVFITKYTANYYAWRL